MNPRPSKHSNPANILFVDDEKHVLEALRRSCRGQGWKITLVESGRDGLDLLDKEHYDLVVSDMRMPEMDGASFLQQVAESHPQTMRILLTGYADMNSTIRAVNEGKIYSYISKPWDNEELKDKISQALYTGHLESERKRLLKLTHQQTRELKTLNQDLEATVEKRTQQLRATLKALENAHQDLKSSLHATVEVLAQLIDLYEQSPSDHGQRAANYARQIALAMGENEENCEQIYFAALLHDIGTIGMPETIVKNSYNKMSFGEKEIYQQHPILGEAALMSINSLEKAGLYIRCHHEYLNGKGYPGKLKGESIPLGARILTVVSDYDDLLEGKLQNDALSSEHAQSYLRSHVNKQYDKQVVNAFCDVLAQEDDMTNFIHETMINPIDLVEGMRLSKNLLSPTGVMLLAKGHVLTEHTVDKIQELELDRDKPFPIYVYQDIKI